MTILPKKKQGKEKTEGESSEHLAHGHSHSHAQSSETRVSRRNSPPPRWNSPTPSMPREDMRNSHDPGGRFDDFTPHEGSSTLNKRRHRSSPHRNVRKHRLDRHETRHDKNSAGAGSGVGGVGWEHWTEQSKESTPQHQHAHPAHAPHRHSSYPVLEGSTYSHLPGIPSTSTQSSDVSLHLGVEDEEEDMGGYNSEDEYFAPVRSLSTAQATRTEPEVERPIDFDELERRFEQALKGTCGMMVKKMGDDGACLFRAVADQVFGDQEMHSAVRRCCVDYMAKNADHFKHYITEDFQTYLNRKRRDNCHGNHIEIQAMSELYNRPVEVYQYSTEPINTFHGAYKTDNEPIRLSYHRNVHYNSVVDPYKATIGVGLGLPGFQPGLADKTQMKDATRQSENQHLEQAMLEDKLRETDWEVTQETIEEQVARESYLQWLRDQEKLAKSQSSPRSASATCSSAAEAQPGWWENKSPTGGRSPRHTGSGQNSPKMPADPNCLSDINAVSTQKLDINKPSGMVSQPLGSPHQHIPPIMPMVEDGACAVTPQIPSTSQDTTFSETTSIMNDIPPQMFGFGEWDEDDVLAQVMAQSQQEYLDSLKQNAASTSYNVSSAYRGSYDNNIPSTSRGGCSSYSGGSRDAGSDAPS